ncbi:unnamed protein product [Pylaiella littoralis]
MRVVGYHWWPFLEAACLCASMGYDYRIAKLGGQLNFFFYFGHLTYTRGGRQETGVSARLQCRKAFRLGRGSGILAPSTHTRQPSHLGTRSTRGGETSWVT